MEPSGLGRVVSVIVGDGPAGFLPYCEALGAPVQLWVLELVFKGEQASLDPSPAGRLTLAFPLSPQMAGMSPGCQLVPAEASCRAEDRLLWLLLGPEHQPQVPAGAADCGGYLGHTWGFGCSLHDPRHWEWSGIVEMTITRQNQVVSSLTYLCVLTGDRQHLDLQQTEPGAAVRAPTPAPCLLPLWVRLTPYPACHPAAFTPFCHPYSPVVSSVRE